MQSALQKKQLIVSFVKNFTENPQILFASFFGFIIQSKVKSGVLNRVSTT